MIQSMKRRFKHLLFKGDATIMSHNKHETARVIESLQGSQIGEFGFRKSLEGQ